MPTWPAQHKSTPLRRLGIGNSLVSWHEPDVSESAGAFASCRRAEVSRASLRFGELASAISAPWRHERRLRQGFACSANATAARRPRQGPFFLEHALLAEGRLTGRTGDRVAPEKARLARLGNGLFRGKSNCYAKVGCAPSSVPIAFAIAGAPLGFEPLRFATTAQCRPGSCDAAVMPSTIHAAGCPMVPLYLVLAFFFGLTVMQISPAELTAIDTVAAIAGLAAFAICALLFVEIVLTLKGLSGQ